MLFSTDAFIGIDLTQGKKTIYYAALDGKLGLISLAQGDLKSVMTFLASQHQAVVGIHGPARPNMGILTDAERRNQLPFQFGKGRPGNMRVAEYELRQKQLAVYRTPRRDEDAPGWMQTSFKCYQRLREMDYQPFQMGIKASRQFLEVIPEHGYRAWAEGVLIPAHTLAGRIQRQLILYDRGVGVGDPMDFFEEITRFRIRQGVLPEEMVYSAPILAALAAATIAWQTVNEPEQLALLGVAEEGQITVPKKLIGTGD
ncbi:DUF429 domain-containing protein [bacterium]|nr:DUF429 domain-containing protein [bacterium]MCB2179237.1 DUF429 domain-containing protein [bacterium]